MIWYESKIYLLSMQLKFKKVREDVGVFLIVQSIFQPVASFEQTRYDWIRHDRINDDFLFFIGTWMNVFSCRESFKCWNRPSTECIVTGSIDYCTYVESLIDQQIHVVFAVNEVDFYVDLLIFESYNILVFNSDRFTNPSKSFSFYVKSYTIDRYDLLNFCM